MPCRDGGESDGDKATRLLCGLIRRVKKIGKMGLVETDEELAEWWKWHQREDRARTTRNSAQAKYDRLKEEARKKLSKAERRALGMFD